MGIFRLTKGELKKIFLKPGIFIVTTLLVVVLTLSALLFKPAYRQDAGLANVSGSTIGQMYDKSFGSTETNNTLSKTYLTNNCITSSEDIIDFYNQEITAGENSKKAELTASVRKIYDHFVEYKKVAEIKNPNTDVQNSANEKRAKLKELITEFQSLYTKFVNGTNGFYYVLLSSNDKTEFDVFMSKCLTAPFTSTLPHEETVKVIIYDLDMFATMNSYIEKMNTFLPKQEDLFVAETNLADAKTKIGEIEQEIETFKAEKASSDLIDDKSAFKTLITRFQQANMNAYKLTLLTINSSALSEFSDDYIQSLYQFENSEYRTKYVIKEQKNVCKFYLDNNKYAFEYAIPLSLSTSSNFEPNMYDFMFFALEFCSFIIVIYVAFLGATMIAGEYSSGTMKLLAIRPYSRRKILFSKLLATVIVGLIFLVMSFITTSIVGAILYSTSSLPILLIFNAGTVASVSPIISILLLFLCKSIELLFYAIFAISISTWFKSNAGCVVVSLLLYFVSFILTMFTPSLGIVKFLPFVNTNLFGYFGSHLISTSSNNIFVTMFSKVIANDMTFYSSFAIIAFFSVILYAITSEIFARRDIK
ncbi:MAG: ABC transporter permease [Christensenellales bacterium]